MLFRLVVGKGEEDIDIGVGKKVFAAVASERDQGDTQAGMTGESPAPHFNQDAVDDGGAAANGGGAVAGSLVGGRDKRHLPLILLP